MAGGKRVIALFTFLNLVLFFPTDLLTSRQKLLALYPTKNNCSDFNFNFILFPGWRWQFYGLLAINLQCSSPNHVALRTQV